MEIPRDFLMENEISSRFKLKQNSIRLPTQSLGIKVTQVTLESITVYWSFHSSQYIPHMVKNVELHLDKNNETLLARAKEP